VAVANEGDGHGIFVAIGSDGLGYGLLDLAESFNYGIDEMA